MNDNKAIRVTTIDNPYDPFTHWEQWWLFDINAGYNTCGRLATVSYISDSMSNQEAFESAEQGIEKLMKTGAINKQGEIVEYVKVFK
ncbi:MAG: hypothetical protein ACNA7U_03845 [Candidatus Izemoplasmataceae bacterium]